MRHAAALAVLTLLASTPAGAAEEKAQAVGQYVDLSPVALPVVVDRQLVNYVFVQARVNLSSFADSAKVREKEPYLRDALVRAGHRTPFTVRSDFTRIDESRLKAALLAEARAIAGARNVASVSVISQTPKQRRNLPRPTAR